MDAPIKEAGYENIYVDCPHCGRENTYNRRSDLSNVEPIARMNNLKCEHCAGEYSIFSDTIKKAKYLWFLKEISVLKSHKNYMLYILYLCQACETFFEQAVINKKLDRSTKIRCGDGHVDTKKYNQERASLNGTSIFELCGEGPQKVTFAKATFHHLRKVFLHEFNSSGNQKVASAFEVIRKTNIHELRNKVIHKTAYRPTLTEIEQFDPLISALYFIGRKFDIVDSIYLLN